MNPTSNDIDAALHLASLKLIGSDIGYEALKDKHQPTLSETDLLHLADMFYRFGTFARGDFKDVPVFGTAGK